MLSEIASIYDPLGLVSPVSVSGKMIYRDTCDNNIPWDKELPQDLKSSWNNWRRRLPRKIEVPRSLVPYREVIQAIDLHAFGDASGKGTYAAVYAVIQQNQGTAQGLVPSKSCLAKKGLTIPRLELVSGLMATKLLDNIKAVLDGLPIRHCYSWLDSMVALYWISGRGSYKQFVANRVRLIQEKSYIIWKHVGTKENPADIGSRGCQADQFSTKWLEGPEWLSNPDDWPNEVTVEATEETEAEAKQKSGEILKAVTQIEDEFNELLSKYSFWKTMRITAGLTRFLHNLKSKQERRKGPLSTEEIRQQIDWWLKREQLHYEDSDQTREDKQRLNLQKNERGLLECQGRIQGEKPIYIPPESLLAEKLVMHEHKRTLHGGVNMTMSAERKIKIPRLRRMTKKVRSSCNAGKRFQTIAFTKPPTGNLPKDR